MVLRLTLSLVVLMEGRCFKCRKTVEIKKGKEIVNKKGLRAMKGECPDCGTTVYRIIGK